MSNTPPGPRRPWLRIAAGVLLLVAFALRAWQLPVQSVWFDEGWSWYLASLPLADMAAVTAGDRSPVLYYTLLHGWISLAGDSEFAMRFISALADTATVALLVAFARAVAPRARNWTVLFPALLWSVHPFALWYAQEARMYALVGALCSGSTYALWRWLRPGARHPGDPRWLLGSAAVLALALHTHYYAAFAMPAQAVLVVLCIVRRSGPRNPRVLARAAGPYAASVLAVLAVFVPWLMYAARGFAYSDGFAAPINTIDGRTAEWFTAFITGGLAPQAPALAWAAVIGALALGVLRQAWRRDWLVPAVLVALGVLPVLSGTIAVRVFFADRSVFHPRYLIYAAPMLCLLGAAPRAARGQPGRFAAASIALGTAVLLAVWLPMSVAMHADPAVARDDTRAAVQHVIEALAPGDAAVMSRDNYAVRYYDRAGRIQYAAPFGLHGVLRDTQALERDLNANRLERVRLVLWQDDVVDPQRLLEGLLWANGYQIGELNFRQIRLPLYQLARWPVEPPALTPLRATFDDRLDLTGAWISANRSRSNWLYVILRWQPRAPIPRDYKVYVHVTDSQGRLRFQRDKIALNALVPMSQWKAGSLLQDGYAMVIPPDVEPGVYRVSVGVYDPVTGARLPVTRDGAPDGDEVVIGTPQIDR